MVPLVESCPVVATNQQGELVFRVILADGLQRMPGIRWLRQAELLVACLQLWLVLQRFFYHFQAQLVVGQVGSGLLEWVHGRNHEPHLVQAGLLAKAFRQCDMARMDGVEATAKDSYLLHFLLCV